MKEALRAALLSDPRLTSLVGERITWAALPRSMALPAIALHQISGVRDYHMTAPSHLVASRVQVDCWANANKDATRLARAVNDTIGGYRGTVAGVLIHGAFLESEQDMTDVGGGAPAELLHRVSLDFMVWHSE